MITQYTQPLQQSIVDQYVPIPFEHIRALAKEYKDDYDTSVKRVQDFNKEYGALGSRSQSDNASWDEMTRGQMKDVVEKIGSNSDLLASSEGQAEILKKINSLDYNKLAILKKNKEEYDKEVEAFQKAKASGMNIDTRFSDPNKLGYSSFDSKGGSQIYTAQMPVEFKPLKSVFDEYFKDMKASDLGSSGVYNYTGNSRERLAKVANSLDTENLSRNEVVRRELEWRDQNGIIPASYYRTDKDGNKILDKDKYIKKLALDSQMEKVYSTKDVDSYKLTMFKMAYAQKQKEKADQEAFSRTAQLGQESSRAIASQLGVIDKLGTPKEKEMAMKNLTIHGINIPIDDNTKKALNLTPGGIIRLNGGFTAQADGSKSYSTHIVGLDGRYKTIGTLPIAARAIMTNGLDAAKIVSSELVTKPKVVNGNINLGGKDILGNSEKVMTVAIPVHDGETVRIGGKDYKILDNNGNALNDYKDIFNVDTKTIVKTDGSKETVKSVLFTVRQPVDPYSLFNSTNTDFSYNKQQGGSGANKGDIVDFQE